MKPFKTKHFGFWYQDGHIFVKHEPTRTKLGGVTIYTAQKALARGLDFSIGSITIVKGPDAAKVIIGAVGTISIANRHFEDELDLDAFMNWAFELSAPNKPKVSDKYGTVQNMEAIIEEQDLELARLYKAIAKMTMRQLEEEE